MHQSPRNTLQAANPLIKLVREREDLFFQLFQFVKEHLEASSNDLDGLTVFNKFLVNAHIAHETQLQKEHEFYKSFADLSQQPIPKQLMRLTMRIIEILEASLARTRKSVFQDSGRANKQFSRFKLNFQKVMKNSTFSLKNYADQVLGYCTLKYLKQINKVQKYVERVGQGEDIWLKDIYHKDNSDVESSPDQRKATVLAKTVRKVVHKVDKIQGEHFSSADDQDYKVSTKKVIKPTIKRRERPAHIKNKPNEHETQQPMGKEQNANKLLKFYAMLELNKKQFLQDYVYDKMDEQPHRNALLDKLLDRNKQINKQINNYVKKSSGGVPKIIIIPVNGNQSSGDEKNESNASKLSLRTSFVISKRKTSFQIDNQVQHQKTSQGQNKQMMDSTIKNINPRRRSSHSNHRPHLQDKSKKLFVVKSPMMFEDDVIPQAQIAETHWLGAALTHKGRDHRNDNIRLKRKNNPTPMDNAFLPEAFHYPI